MEDNTEGGLYGKQEEKKRRKEGIRGERRKSKVKIDQIALFITLSKLCFNQLNVRSSHSNTFSGSF